MRQPDDKNSPKSAPVPETSKGRSKADRTSGQASDNTPQVYIERRRFPRPFAPVDVMEMDSDSVWATFQSLSAEPVKAAATPPQSNTHNNSPGSKSSGERDKVPTQPMSLESSSGNDPSSGASTRAMSLDEMPGPHQMWQTLASLAKDKSRIADAIESMWGQDECLVYMQQLILDGCDQNDRAAGRLTQDEVSDLLVLISLHRAPKT